MSELLCKLDRMVAAMSSTPELQTSSVANTAGASGTKLPKLTIAPFAGDLCRWNDFWEQFDQMIHRNGSLTATDKFNYLRFFLRGDASSAIVGLPTTEACYKDAIDILKRRFGDKTRLEQEYFSRLRTLPSVRSSDSTALRKLYDQVVINIRGLETLGVSKTSFSAMLCDILLRALPHDLVVHYHRSCANRTTSDSSNAASITELERLLQFLSIELESLEKSELANPRGRDSHTENAQNKSRQFRGSKPTSSVLHNNAMKVPENCVFCKSSQHSTEDCSLDLPLPQKKHILSGDMRCFRCTTKGHRACDCRRKITCSTCQGRHATSVCDPQKLSQKTRETGRTNARIPPSKPSTNTTMCASLGTNHIASRIHRRASSCRHFELGP